MKRWLFFGLVGLAFGVFDFHWQNWTSGISSLSTVLWFLVAWGIFLIPAALVAGIEYRASGSKIKAGLAAALCFCLAIVSYYTYMGVLHLFRWTRSDIHISQMAEPHYWGKVAKHFGEIVQGDMAEWLGMAVVGGFAVGVVVSAIYGLLAGKFRKRTG